MTDHSTHRILDASPPGSWLSRPGDTVLAPCSLFANSIDDENGTAFSS